MVTQNIFPSQTPAKLPYSYTASKSDVWVVNEPRDVPWIQYLKALCVFYEISNHWGYLTQAYTQELRLSSKLPQAHMPEVSASEISTPWIQSITYLWHNIFVNWKRHKSEISKAQRCHLNWFKCKCTGKRWGRVDCSSLASRLALSFSVSSCTVSSQSGGYTARVSWGQQMAPKAICLR